jgi:outer membrane protein TolC
MSVNLPIYHKRMDAGVREAETQAVASAREYDALKDQTMQEVKDLFTKAKSEQELLRLFREDIIRKAKMTLDQSIRAYRVQEVDFLQMIDNWRQLLRFHITEAQLESQLRQTLASLDRVVGSYEVQSLAAEPLPALPPNE